MNNPRSRRCCRCCNAFHLFLSDGTSKQYMPKVHRLIAHLHLHYFHIADLTSKHHVPKVHRLIMHLRLHGFHMADLNRAPHGRPEPSTLTKLVAFGREHSSAESKQCYGELLCIRSCSGSVLQQQTVRHAEPNGQVFHMLRANALKLNSIVPQLT